jgi:class 3 adenylate cyclase/TolB-like protein/Flp pilus assembly protein TadD
MPKDSRIIAAILAADVVDYSRLMGADEPGTLAALKARRAIFAGQVAEFGGREFGSVGDSLMAEFHSAVNAVSAALAIQDRVASENAALPRDKQMLLRIGVTLGDVIEEQSGVFGDTVNLAARLQALARPGGVTIAGPVYDQVHGKVAARFVDAGTRQVKNIREPVRTFEVLPAAPAGFGGRIASALSGFASRRILRSVFVGCAIGVALGLGLFWRDIPVPGTGRTMGALLEPGSRAPPNALAVLPFVNLTGDPANDYLGDGLAEELHHRLSRVKGLRIAARRSAFAYKGRDEDVRGIADALGVSYVIEGSVRRQGDIVRVNASLVDRATGANAWSDSYESTGDVPAIEEAVGRQVLAALEQVLALGPQSSPVPSHTGDIAAYDLYLQGLSYLRRPTSARTLDAAEQLFLRSLAEDTKFARAQAGLCRTRVERFFLERDPAQVDAAEAACARAQALDDSAFEVHEAVGGLRLVSGDAAAAASAFRDALAIVPESPDALIGLAAAIADGGDLQAAERTLEQAIAVQPSYAASHMERGSLLMRQGRAREAIASYRRVSLLEPDNPAGFNNLGVAYLAVGDFEESTKAFARALEIEPRLSTYSNIGTGLYYRGDFAEAARMFRKATELGPSNHRLWGNLADALLFAGRQADSREAYARAFELAEGELAVNPRHSVNSAQAAYYATRLGHGERARRHIDNALSAGNNENEVHYYVGLAELGLGDRERAADHLRRARELGYPEAFLRSAPELRQIRQSI